MSLNSRNGSVPSSSLHQRRTLSADGYSLPHLDDDYYKMDGKYNSGVANGIHETVKEGDEEYTCVPLPKMNNRPTARTCW